jgi:hypothetical protein
MTAPGSIDEDTAWNLVRAVRPEYIGERTSTRVHHGLEHDVWLQVDGSGAWKTSVAVTPEARDIFELFLPIRLRTDLAIAQSAQSVDGRSSLPDRLT